MNARLQQLMDQSFTDHQGEQFDPERFAELIVKECVKQCQQEWYDLNDTPDLVDARLAAMLVGQKNGVLKASDRIKKYFGVE
jgi:hypothetical protein